MATRPSMLARVAGAPISWGVCEAPGWGHELPAEVVLADLRRLGLTATELGPAGYLGDDPARVAALLAAHDLRLVGGFVPVPFHVAGPQDFVELEHAVRILAAGGADVAVLAARSADGGYDARVELDGGEWRALGETLARATALVAEHGLRPVLHPHVGTAVETREDVLRLLELSDVALCLDTGHLVIGGTDPLELLHEAPERVAHVHLKDVRLAVAARVRAGTTGYVDAVRGGLYAALGDGDLDIAGAVEALERRAYEGWYVLEQDVALAGPPAPGAGPVVDVERSVAFLRALADRSPSVPAGRSRPGTP